MRTIPNYSKCSSKNVQLHSNLQEMEPKCGVKWYCEPVGPKMTSDVQEGHIRTQANVEERIHSDSLDLKLQNSIDQKSVQFSVTRLELPEASRFPAHQGKKLPLETETSASEDNDLLFEDQHFSNIGSTTSTNTANDRHGDFSNTGSTTSTNTANDRHSGGLDDKALTPMCKTVSRSKFYVDSSDEDDFTTVEQFSCPLQGHKPYIQRMSNKGVHRKCNNANKQEDSRHLFDCLLLLGLTVGPNTTEVPYTLIKYPSEANIPPYTEYLCFPDVLQWTPSSYEQSYSFVLTSETGQRKFGYCRRVLPEGSPSCLPLVYCILTPFRARGFYHNILRELESRHGQPDSLLSAFIRALYNSIFPKPGQTLQLVPRSSSAEEFFDEALPILRRPHDLRLEEQDLVEMFDILDVTILLKVFGTVLLERKVIFISSSFSKLSSCAEAIQSILYPFSWQHVLISVLPHSLLDICQSPTPYVVGILDNDNHIYDSLHSFQEGIIVNLDESKVLRNVGDENSILPRVSLKLLKASLELVCSTGETAGSSTRNVLISEAFLRMFAELCGHYRRYILSMNGELVFDRVSFINSASSASVRHFLERFAETAMFSAFIDSRLQNEHEEDVFDQRAFERTEEQRKQNKGGTNTAKNIKEKFKYWTRNRH